MMKNRVYVVGRGVLVLATVLALLSTAGLARAEEHDDQIQAMKTLFQERLAVVQMQIDRAQIRIEVALSNAETSVHMPTEEQQEAVETASANAKTKLQEIKEKLDAKFAEMKEESALKRADARAREMDAYASRMFENTLEVIAEAELAALYALEARVEAIKLHQEADKE